jgi:hypothetical protein
MLNDTLELNIAAKFYNKCQTDVNNHNVIIINVVDQIKCTELWRFTDKKET